MAAAAIWYNFFKSALPVNEPPYFEVANEPWVREVEQNYPAIKSEVMEFVQTQAGLLKDYRFHITQGKSEWQTFSLKSWGFVHSSRVKKLPVTWNAFKNMKGVVSVSVSRLIANTNIPAHHGDTNAIYRCHLGLQIPGKIPECCFVVQGEERNWYEGKVLAFCDARFHYAKNQTPTDRYVIIFDRIRDEYADQQYRVCATVIATHVLYMFDAKLHFHKKVSAGLLRVMVGALSPFIQLYLRLQDMLS